MLEAELRGTIHKRCLNYTDIFEYIGFLFFTIVIFEFVCFVSYALNLGTDVGCGTILFETYMKGNYGSH